jgi:hypothetical protein
MVSYQRSAWHRTSRVALLVVLLALAAGHAHAGADAAPTRAGAGLSVAGSVAVVSAGTPAWISAEADFLSGRKLSVVCAASIDDWAQALSDAGFPSGHAKEYYGFSLIREGVMYLSPYVCEGLTLGTAALTRRSNELQVAWSVDVLVHESVHLGRHTVDEALTEACARVGLPLELHRLYRVAYRSAEMNRLTFAAAWARRTQEAAYQGGTCTTA